MAQSKTTGRAVGALLLLHLIGLILPFILILPLNAPDYFASSAAAAPRIKTGVFLLFGNGILTVGIALAVLPALAQSSRRAAYALLVASVVWLCVQAIDNAHIMAMLSLSERFVAAGARNAEGIGDLAAVLQAERRWLHYTELLIVNGWFLLLYLSLFRLAAVPRPLAAFGCTMVLVHTTAIPLAVFIGYPVISSLAVSLALSHLLTAAWLLVRGDSGRFAIDPAPANVALPHSGRPSTAEPAPPPDAPRR